MKARVVVEKVIEFPVVVAQPEPRDAMPVPVIELQENAPPLQVKALFPPVQDERKAPKSLVVEALPWLSIEKSVEVEKAAVEEEIAKSVVGTTVEPVVEAAKMESSAYGVEVPMPRAPALLFQVRVVDPVLPNLTVEEALSPWKSESVVEVALVLTPKLLVGVQS